MTRLSKRRGLYYSYAMENSVAEAPSPKKTAANKILYDLRVSHFLELRGAARALHLPSLLLFLYERGYLPIPKKRIPSIAAFYKVDPSVFDDRLGYPEPIFPEKKDSPLILKLRKILFSWPMLIASLVLLLGSAGTLGAGIGMMDQGQNSVGQYSADYQTLVATVIEKGEEVTDETTGTNRKILNYTASDNSFFQAQGPTQMSELGSLILLAGFPEQEGFYVVAFQEKTSSPWFETVDYTDGKNDALYYGVGYLSSNYEYSLAEVVDTNQSEVTDETVIATQAAYLKKYSSGVASLFENFKTNKGIDISSGLYPILVDQGTGTEKASFLSDTGNNLTLIFSLVTMVFFFMTLFLGSSIFAQRHQAKRASAPSDLADDIPLRNGHQPAALPKNWKIQPFLPETLLRLLGIVLILISSIILFKATVPLLSSRDISLIFDLISGGKTWLNYLPIVTMAMLLWFFVRIEILQNEKYNMWPSTLLFFAMGFLYYGAELALHRYFTNGGDFYYKLLYSIFMTMLPGNLFWGLGCYALIVSFLLSTPKFIKPKFVWIWRSMAILPIVYLVFSYLYGVGTQLWGWPQWEYYFSNLLVRKQFAVIFFAILYPLGVYIYRRILIAKYGQEGAGVYFHGNAYFFTKNLLAATLIALIVVFNVIAGKTANAKTLDMSHGYLMAYLIPIVLFYHPHLGKRSSPLDLGISFLYFVSMSFAYVYLAYFVLFELRDFAVGIISEFLL